MKKISSIYVGILFIIGLCVITFMPMGKAHVWISPMKMLAEGNITDAGFCEVEKAIVLKNSGNDSVIINLTATGIDVSFEDNDFELKAGEEKLIIHPIITVTEGKHEGRIIVRAYEMDIDTGGTGSHAVSSWSIMVTANGTRVSSSAGLDFSDMGVILLVAALGGGAVIAVVSFIIMKKRKSTINMVQRKVHCPKCHKIVTLSGNPGDVVNVTCQKCGAKGRITLPKSITSKRSPMNAGGL